jgi:23S rRNA (guanosine2251-2'-O)-methyltransferase
MDGPGVVNVRYLEGSAGEWHWVFGINAAIRRLEAHPALVREVYLVGSSGRLQRIAENARRLGISLRRSTARQLEMLTGSRSHQGVALRCEPFRYARVGDVLPDASSLLVLDRIQDPQNLGALVRTAVATGMSAVLIPRRGAVAVTPVVEKASTGAVNDIPICRVPNLHRLLGELKRVGFWTIALVPHGGESLFETQLPDRIALVLGGEPGLRPLVNRTCDLRVSIPLDTRVNSLNASVAGAIAMYEIVRRQPLDRFNGRW